MKQSTLAATIAVFGSLASTTVFAGCINEGASPIECDWSVSLGSVTAVPVNACLPAQPAEGIPDPVCWQLTPAGPGPFTLKTALNSSDAGKKYFNVTTFSGTYLAPGAIYPKFQILGVTYAPPGAKSSVSYANSTMLGTSTSNTQTFTSATTQTLTLTLGASTGIAGTGSASVSSSYSQEADNTSSVTVNQTASTSEVTPGPLSSAVGVDHDYDYVWVWLNPAVEFTVSGQNSIAWNGYAYNQLDDAQDGMEVVPLYVTWLKSPSTIPAATAARLARSWDTSGVGGLTSDDYSTILAADPFSNAGYNPLTDSSGRFDEITSLGPVIYQPPPAGDQPGTTAYSLVTQATTSTGQGASSTYTTTASLGGSLSGSNLSVQDKYTAVDKWSSTVNSTAGKTASLSITGPAVSDNYTGPIEFQVWRDNVYGSFMFYPVQ